jgi:hypothetical protein
MHSEVSVNSETSSSLSGIMFKRGDTDRYKKNPGIDCFCPVHRLTATE